MHFRYIHRVKEILTVFLEEEFGYFIKKAQLHHLVPFSKRLKTALQQKESSWRGEVHLRQAFERLGPTFIKFGQLLSLRPDVVPPEYIAEFEKMQDHTPPVSYKEIKQTIKEEFGKDPHDIFVSFDEKPIASASLAQVHRAQLKSGAIVAVKVQRPDIERIIKEDIEILHFLAEWLHKHKALHDFPLPILVEEFKRWTLRELNFMYEASNTKLVAENFRRSSDIIIPRIYDDYSTRRVLTMTFISGVPINNIAKLQKHKNINLIIKKTYRALVEMVLSHGIFHADPHPGNILIHDNKIAFIDFGVVGRFDDHLRDITLKLLNATVTNDPDMAFNAIMELQRKNGITNKQQLQRDVQDILDQVRIEKLKDVQVSQLMTSILDTIHRHQIEVPIDFTLFAKTVITMEGVGLRYSPNFRLLAQTAPLIEREMIASHSPTSLLKGAKKHLDTYKSILEKAPEYALEAMKNLSSGKLSLEVVPYEFSDLRTELEHSSGNIAIGLMIAAIAVSSALIMQIGPAPLIFGIHYLSFYGFGIALFLGLWLVHRTMYAQR